MKLYEINNLICEGYGRVYTHTYTGDEVHDPRPRSLSLGKFKSSRNNHLMSGVNLNYLTKDQLERLQQNLPSVLKYKNLRQRVSALRSLMPDIFNSAYRTYKRDEMNDIDPGVLKFAKIEKPIKTEEEPEKPTSKPTLQGKYPELRSEPEEKPEEIKEPNRHKGQPARNLSDRKKDKLKPGREKELELEELEPEELEPEELESEEPEEESSIKKPIQPIQPEQINNNELEDEQ
jgi:hypothetical protein